MRLRLSSSRSERGSVLLVAICTMLIIGLALLTYLQLGKNQNQLVMRSQVWNACLPLAEAGVEDALNHSAVNISNMLSSGWSLSASNTFVRSNSFTEGAYSVSISTNAMASNFITITATGYYPMPGSTAMQISRSVRVQALKIPQYRFCLYGKTEIDFNGNGIRLDSFDSRDATKSTGGLYDVLKAGANANVGTYNGTPAATYDVGNANIWGKVIMGAGGKIKIGSNGKVGSVAYQATGPKGTYQPGWFRTDLNISIPDVSVPFSAGLPALPGIVDGVLYTQVFGSGTYWVNNLNGNAIVTGDALIYVSSSFVCDSFVLKTNCTTQLYLAGNDCRFKDTINGSQRAANFLVLGMNTCKTFTLDDGFIGAVYVPYARTEIKGSKQIYGSVCADKITLSGGSDVHFDEALLAPQSKGTFIITSWTEL